MKKMVLTSLMIAMCGFANAQDSTLPNIEKTMDRIKRTNTITIGHRSGSIPFSYYGENKQPVGFALDICNQVVDTIKTQYKLPNLQVRYVEVNGDTRVPFVEKGTIDLECGSTTNNSARRAKVDFSIPFYVAGVKVMGRTEDKLSSINSIKNKKVVVVKGTTASKTVDSLNKSRLLNLTTVEVPDYSSALDFIANKKADIVIADDILLYGERSKVANPNIFSLVPDSLSVEPLAIMMAKNDKEINAIVNKHMVKIMNNGEFDKLYKKWFMNPINPSGKSLNVPMNDLLVDVVRFPTHVVGN